MTVTIERIDHTDPTIKEKVRSFLAPHEPHAMFILGNLRTKLPADLYVASRDGRWVGVCGYYGTFKSLIPFSTDPDVVCELVRHVAGAHPQIEWLNGIDYVAAPAYEVMLSMDYQPDNDPHQVFMELEGCPPPQAEEAFCRQIREEDAEEVVLLLRLFGDGDATAEVSREEIDQMRANSDRWVLVKEGRVVSTAATSGLGIEACQIIAVATDPAHRRRGYARAVCASLIRAMGDRGARRSLLFTGNVAARRCYEGMGFRATGKYYVAKFKPKGA